MGVSIKFLSLNSYNSAKTQRLTLLRRVINVFLKQE
jgi:hypothetical protein